MEIFNLAKARLGFSFLIEFLNLQHKSQKEDRKINCFYTKKSGAYSGLHS